MPKGRNFAPDVSGDGNWYEHLGLPRCYSEPPGRASHTSTGQMLNAPYKPDSTYYPFDPPRGYLLRDSRNFKLAHDFSAHNNRYLLEGTGEYFGDGQTSRLLGRRLAAEHLRHHTTPGNFLHDVSHSCASDDRASIYSGSYNPAPPLRAMAHRRYPRVYSEPGADVEPSTTTTHWHQPPRVPYQTPLHVLATSQEPLLRANTWKYSYHGQPRYYPPYTPLSRRRLTPV